MLYYVYGLIDPRDGQIFYIGKGKDDRMFCHVKCVKIQKIPNGNLHMYYKIKSILDNGFNDLLYTKFFESDDENECYNMEKNIILEHKNNNINLCNLTDGGDGVHDEYGIIADRIRLSCIGRDMNGEKNPFYGKKHSEETKNKISESLKGKESNFKGKTHSEYSKLKNKLSHTGKTTWNKGIPMSDESKKKMSETKKGKIPWNKGKEIDYNKECKICNTKFKTLTDKHMVRKHNITLKEYYLKYQ